jgi:hypothetical protein
VGRNIATKATATLKMIGTMVDVRLCMGYGVFQQSLCRKHSYIAHHRISAYFKPIRIPKPALNAFHISL